jgi:carboxyl-terminal processing protease
VEIVRDAVPQPSISEIYMIRPGVGYMAMRGGFNQTTFNEFRQGLAELKQQGMEYLVLDLRDNGGGLVNQAYQVANTFLSNGQIVFTQKGRLGGTVDPFRAENNNPDKTPIVMLVNRNTASASEILAGALQDHDRALVVGESTFGKGLVQNPFLIEYGSMLLLTIAKYETPSGRLIQRDYSNGNLYDYYTKGGTLADENKQTKPTGAESKTDTGRIVYSGGGITPDEVIKPQTIPTERFNQQEKMRDPIFAFALDLAYGKMPGFESYKVDRPLVFDYDLKSTDFQITDNLYQAFKKYAIEKFKYTAPQIDKEREFVERALRTELVTAAYGSTTSLQILNDFDNQLKKAIEVLPRAKQLALESARVNAQKTSAEVNR